MSQPPETALVHTIRRALESTYPEARILKVHGSLYSATGFPDLLVLLEGRAYALEVKHVRTRSGETPDRARERCSARQRLVLSELRSVGVPADVVTSAAEALAVVSGAVGFDSAWLFDLTANIDVPV